MHVVTVEFVVKPEHAATFLPAMIANARASREREPGCRQFDVCAAPGDSATVFLYEVYDDRAAFDAHLATPHFKAFDAAVGPWIERKTVRTYARADPP
jgi:autoinducer 2-degrading protein